MTVGGASSEALLEPAPGGRSSSEPGSRSSDPPRVVFLNPWDRWIGPNRYLVEMLRHCPDLAARATVVFHEESDALPEYRALGCRVAVWPEIGLIHPHLNWRNFGHLLATHTLGLGRVVSRLRALQPDVVVTNTDNICIGGMAAGLARIPHVQVVHSLAYQFRWEKIAWVLRGYVSWLSFLTRRFIGVSGAVRDMLEDFGVGDRKIAVVPNGFDIPRIRESSRSPLPPQVEALTRGRFPVLVSIGRLAPMKGQDVLIEALRSIRARHPSLLCLLVGRQAAAESVEDVVSFPGRLMRKVHEYRLDDCVHFLGEVEYVPELLSRADLYIHPSLSESFSRVVAEALILGKPVVCTRAGGLPEVVGQGGALLVAPADPRALSAGISEALEGEGVREKIASCGRSHVEDHYSLPETARRFCKVLASAGGGDNGSVMQAGTLKGRMKMHWEAEPCDSRYGRGNDGGNFFQEVSRKRYELEPFIPGFADFAGGKGKRVLEVGVGLGVDFWGWVKSGARATGVDLTSRAIRLTREHLDRRGISRGAYHLSQTDAESLPFCSHVFDLVYSWGVLHHTPRTEKAFREVSRVLAPGGVLKAMVYHLPSWTGWLLWMRYGLLTGKPFSRVGDLLSKHLESPGTKAYRVEEMKEMLFRAGFEDVRTRPALGPSDLLTIPLGSKYTSSIYGVAQALYPRWLVRRTGDRYGLLLTIEAKKTTASAGEGR